MSAPASATWRAGVGKQPARLAVRPAAPSACIAGRSHKGAQHGPSASAACYASRHEAGRDVGDGGSDGVDADRFLAQSGRPSVPWQLAWQVRGRESLEWSVLDRGALVRQAALEQCGWPVGEYERRFADLLALLPELPRYLPAMQPEALVAALADVGATAQKLVLLKGQLPHTNVGRVLLLHPPLFTWTQEQVLGGLQHARGVLGSAEVAEEVLQWHPALMDPELLGGAIVQLRRLVPHVVQRAADARELVHLLGIVLKARQRADIGQPLEGEG